MPAGTTASAPDATAAAWLPLAGAVTGALAGFGGELAARASHPLGVAAAFALSLILTGAIHVDGFLDGCDAFFAQVPAARRLEILKDPHHGTFALAGFAALAAVWLAALWSIQPAAYPASLALAAAAARWGAVTNMRSGATAVPLLVGLLLVAVLAVVCMPSPAAGALTALVGIAASTAALVWARARLDGAAVGDAYGFAIVLGEVGALIAAALAVARSAVTGT